jgi:hypothetical protein
MALLDRFRRPPQWKSDDPLARIAGVEELPLDQQDVLVAIAREDGDSRVRRAAVRKIIDPALVADVAQTDRDESVREEAVSILRDLALGVFENTTEAESLAALRLLQDVRDVMTVAESASLEAVWRAAIARLDDPKALATVARRASLPAARVEALQRLSDPAEIVAVALKSEHKDVAIAAVERITDRESLKAVSAKAAAKVAARRARVLLESLDEKARPAEDVPSPEAAAAEAGRARQLDLCRQTEALGRISLGAKELAARILRAEASWAEVASSSDVELGTRFAAAIQAAQGLLARAEAAEAERGRLAAEVAAVAAVRSALCERVDAIEGEEAQQLLEQARHEWASLPPFPSGNDAQARALARRFEEAASACERRHARALAAKALRLRAEGLCQEADRVADATRFPEAGQQWASVAGAWRELLAAGLKGEDLAEHFRQAEDRFRARELQAREIEARHRQANLGRLGRLCARVEGQVSGSVLSLKDAERSLRDLRVVLDDMPALPSKQDHDDMVRRMRDLQAALLPKVRELREIDEWQRWANVGVQEQLCERAEALAVVTDVAELAGHLRELQDQWKRANLVPREKAQALWTRFKAATDQARARCDMYFAQQAEERGRNLARKESLCQQAEAMAESTDWIRTAEAIKALQAEWKMIGPVVRGQELAVWERFRRACDRFFTRRHEDLARRKEEWAANLAKKQALCERVEALAASTDWEQGMGEVRRAQVEWRGIGPVRKNRSEAIWQRFRSASDAFVERYRDRDNAKIAAERSQREALVGELEALAPSINPEADGSELPVPPDDLVDRVSSIRTRWLELERTELGRRATWAPLDERYLAALERVLNVHAARFKDTLLDPDTTRRAMIQLCEKVEETLGRLTPVSDPASSPAAVLARQLREALAANTLGGRVAATEVEDKWRHADEEVRSAEDAWRALGPLPGEAGQALARRFQHACRRFADQRDRHVRPSPQARGAVARAREGSTASRRPR